MTRQLSPALTERLKEKEAADFSYTPAPVEWDGKYLLIEQATANYDNLDYHCNKALNEKLNIDRFFPGNDINGIVWPYDHFRVVGRYEGGGNATQSGYVLHYLDLTQNAVLARDTVWGEMPPETKHSYDSPNGKYPNEEDVIAAIRNRVK